MEPGGSVQYGVRSVSYAPEGPLQAEFSLPVSSIDDATLETRTTHFRADVLPREVVRFRVDYYLYPADVLFIVDTSARTGAFASEIRTELAQLADALRWSWRPVRLAMTSADVSEAGLQGAFIVSDENPGIIDAREPGARDRLLAKFDSLQWNGPDSPQPLEAMARALTPPLSDGANTGFTDPDRATQVFIITASDDHSPSSVDEYVEIFRTGPGPKTRPEAWFGSSILAAMSFLPPRCSDVPLTGRLEQAAIATLGMRFELCDPTDNYYSAFHIYDAEFPTLQCLGPRPDMRVPIRIWLDDVEISEFAMDGSRNWSYEPVNNCIEFDPNRFLDRHPASFEYEYEAAPECSP